MICPICGNENQDGATFCLACEAKLASGAATSQASGGPAQQASAPDSDYRASAPDYQLMPRGYQPPAGFQAPADYQPPSGYQAPVAESPQADAAGALPGQGSASSVAGFADKLLTSAQKNPGTTRVLGLVAGIAVVLLGIILRVVNYNVFNVGGFLYGSFSEYFFPSLTPTVVLAWLGALTVGAGCMVRNRVVIGVGFAVIALSSAIGLVNVVAQATDANAMSTALSSVANLLELAAAILASLVCFRLIGSGSSASMRLLPVAAFVVVCVFSLVRAFIVGRPPLYTVIAFLNDAALVALSFAGIFAACYDESD